MTLDDIKRPIEKEMADFEPFFRKKLKSPNSLLSIVTNYLLRRKGKQMRPMLTFLAAKATGEISEATYAAATLIELLHTATLVHDDVVDETYQRRGQFSVNAIWNSKVAVLVGDFFLARGLQISLETNQYDVLRIVSDAVSEISEGELFQIEHARKLDITEETYFEVIRKKTATLIAACTKSGAHSTKSSPEVVEAMYQYGMNLGIAFQIKDDIFDFEKSDLLGKPSGNDIKERKITLPLIYALSNAGKKEASEMMKLISKRYKEDETAAKATEFVIAHGGIEYARKKMMEYAEQSKRCLDILPDSDAKSSLCAIVDYNMSRKK
ncbi:MAG: polyprenyl synthetase family protein [Bacteroidales bacterium]|nr:polyprenyl synthetase family protein [Bacteroidales bacterium]